MYAGRADLHLSEDEIEMFIEALREPGTSAARHVIPGVRTLQRSMADIPHQHGNRMGYDEKARLARHLKLVTALFRACRVPPLRRMHRMRPSIETFYAS